MKVLVTGGCGFIGSHVCEFYATRGDSVVAFDNMTKHELSRTGYAAEGARNYNYKDITSGFRRYSRKAMSLLLSKQMKSKSFDLLFESAMHIYRNNLIISEVPITYRFSNSSLSPKVVKDSVYACARSIFDRTRCFV